MTRNSFDYDIQTKFKQSLARVAGVALKDVTILSITSMTRRRLLSSSIHVGVGLNVMDSVSARKLVDRITIPTINVAFASDGLPNATVVQMPTIVVNSPTTSSTFGVTPMPMNVVLSSTYSSAMVTNSKGGKVQVTRDGYFQGAEFGTGVVLEPTNVSVRVVSPPTLSLVEAQRLANEGAFIVSNVLLFSPTKSIYAKTFRICVVLDESSASADNLQLLHYVSIFQHWRPAVYSVTRPQTRVVCVNTNSFHAGHWAAFRVRRVQRTSTTMQMHGLLGVAAMVSTKKEDNTAAIGWALLGFAFVAVFAVLGVVSYHHRTSTRHNTATY